MPWCKAYDEIYISKMGEFIKAFSIENALIAEKRKNFQPKVYCQAFKVMFFHKMMVNDK